jgi:hypothetical protein
MPSVSTASEVRPSGRVWEAEAAETLAGRDLVLAGPIAQAGPMRLSRLRSPTHFCALVLVGPAADLAYQKPRSPA